MKRNDTLYFCTSKKKEIYRQLMKNPVVEISATGGNGTRWLRIRGTIEFDETKDAKAQVFKEAPHLLNIYPEGAEDELFLTFYFKEAEARLFSFNSAPVDIPLL